MIQFQLNCVIYFFKLDQMRILEVTKLTDLTDIRKLHYATIKML